MKVSKDKTYRTFDGRPVKIYEIFKDNSELDQQVHGAVLTDGDWVMESWTLNGRYYAGNDSNHDLKQIPDYYEDAPDSIWIVFSEQAGVEVDLIEPSGGVKYKKVPY